MRIVASGFLGRAEQGTDRANLTFPMALSLTDDTLIATLRSGPEKDTPRDRIEVYRSADNGATWSGPDYPFTAPDVEGSGGSLKICYLTELGPGRLIAASMWIDRTTYPGQPLFNAETEGCLPMAILLADSYDNGRTWSAWRHVPMPDDIGPPSLTCPILRLADGRLAMSIETNKPYLDRSKWQQRAVYIHSADEGKTWSAPVTVAEDPTGRIFNWDLRAAVAPDGRIASFAWTYDSQTSTYLDIHRRVSSDGGLSWSAPEAIGVSDQAARPAIRPDGSIVLAWVDRFGSKSIRARYAPSLDAPFDPASEVVVYTHGAGEAASADTGDMLSSMDLWSFGLPFAEVLPDGDILVFYYAGEPKALDVRWTRLAV
ncbi:MAG: sialidase family protein [Devosia sp.]